MSSATGNAYLYTIIIIFIGAFCLLLVGSAAYSKAFKIKNTIIDMITENVESNNTNVTGDVDGYLASIGYQAKAEECPKVGDIKKKYFNDDSSTITPSPRGISSGYDYCVYKISYDSNYYYKVITYMRMEFPLVNRIKIPVSGDTRTFGGGL